MTTQKSSRGRLFAGGVGSWGASLSSSEPLSPISEESAPRDRVVTQTYHHKMPNLLRYNRRDISVLEMQLIRSSSSFTVVDFVSENTRPRNSKFLLSLPTRKAISWSISYCISLTENRGNDKRIGVPVCPDLPHQPWNFWRFDFILG